MKSRQAAAAAALRLMRDGTRLIYRPRAGEPLSPYLRIGQQYTVTGSRVVCLEPDQFDIWVSVEPHPGCPLEPVVPLDHFKRPRESLQLILHLLLPLLAGVALGFVGSALLRD